MHNTCPDRSWRALTGGNRSCGDPWTGTPGEGRHALWCSSAVLSGGVCATAAPKRFAAWGTAWRCQRGRTRTPATMSTLRCFSSGSMARSDDLAARNLRALFNGWAVLGPPACRCRRPRLHWARLARWSSSLGPTGPGRASGQDPLRTNTMENQRSSGAPAGARARSGKQTGV